MYFEWHVKYFMMTILELISQNCNFNYNTKIPSELILQKFMLGEYFEFFWVSGPVGPFASHKASNCDLLFILVH